MRKKAQERSHKPDCTCPVCIYRRRGQGERTPMRSMRLPDDVWAWLQAQPNRAAQYLVEHVRDKMGPPKRSSKSSGRPLDWDVVRLGPCCNEMQAMMERDIIVAYDAPNQRIPEPGVYLPLDLPRLKAAHNVAITYCPFCGWDVRPHAPE